MADARAWSGDPGGTTRAGLRVILWEAAAGKCATCHGETLLDTSASNPRAAQIGHIVSVGDSKDMRPFGVINQCARCNGRARNQGISDISDYVDFSLLPTIWPTRAECKAKAPKADTDLPPCPY